MHILTFLAILFGFKAKSPSPTVYGSSTAEIRPIEATSPFKPQSPTSPLQSPAEPPIRAILDRNRRPKRKKAQELP